MIFSLKLLNLVNSILILLYFNFSFNIKLFYYNISLHSIDVSSCPLLTEEGISNFIQIKPNLIKFACASNQTYITGFNNNFL